LQIYHLVHPIEFDYSANNEIYSLPMLLFRTWRGPASLLICKLPLAVILLMSLSPLALSERWRRMRVAIVTVALCILSHYLSYFLAYEYHYTTLLPLLPVLLWLWRNEEVRWLRWLVLASLLVSSIVFLPTPNFLSKEINDHWLACAVVRLAPVCAAFLLLTVYGVAMTWLGVRGTWKALPEQVLSRLRGAERPAAVIGVLLATVVTVAFVTVPDRLLVTPSDWTSDDWREHLEDISSRPGIGPMAAVSLHYSLATVYTKTDPKLAGQHYREARRIVSEHAELSLEMVHILLENHRKDSAAELLADIPAEKLTDPKLRQELETLCKQVQVKKKAGEK
jgi:hypothetical protein